MSTIRDAIKKADNTPDVSAETKENLKIIMDLAESKAKIFEDQIVMDLKNGKTTDDLTVPITKVSRRVVDFRAVTSKSSSVIDELQKAITGMVDDHSASGIVKGVASICNTALTTIMGVGAGEEQTVNLYSVVADYPAIVRFDFAFWGRKIAAKSLTTYCETALACVAYKSAVDVSKLAFNDFLSLYGPVLNAGFGSDRTKMKEMLKQAREIYALYLDDPTKAVAMAFGNGLADPSEEMLSHVEKLCVPQGVVYSPAIKATVGDF